MSDYISSNE